MNHAEPTIGGLSVTEWEQWFSLVDDDVHGKPLRGMYVNMNRSDSWSITTTLRNHLKSIAMDEHGIGHL